jgi:hypothetical protein
LGTPGEAFPGVPNSFLEGANPALWAFTIMKDDSEVTPWI